jgi:hypothetical protein
MIGSQLTDHLTPCSRVLLEKLIVRRPTDKIWTLYQAQGFTMFAIVCHMSLSLDQSNPFPPSCFLNVCYNVIHLSLPGCSKWRLSVQVSPDKICAQLLSPSILHTPHILWFDLSNNVLWRKECINLLIIESSDRLHKRGPKYGVVKHRRAGNRVAERG